MGKFLKLLPGIILIVLISSTATAAGCDRACLYGFLDDYLAAIDARDPSGLPLAQDVRFTENSVEMAFPDGMWNAVDGHGDYDLRFTENSVEMAFPDGMWNSVDGHGDYDLRFADEQAGQVGLYTVVTENGNPAILALRMKVAGGKISEIETIMGRYVKGADFPSPSPQTLYITRHSREGSSDETL